jgi:hypothetical protein
MKMMGTDMTKNNRSRAKHKRWIYAILAALVVLTAQPLIAAAEGRGFVDTDVSAVVYPFYEFTLPPSATVRYPNTQVLVGQFGVNDLLLLEGETLSIELIPGAMRARGTGNVLPYSVTFNPPATVDAANIGEAYDVVVTIDAAAFAATRRPFHDADLVFRVRSLLTGDIVWQGTTTVTARKTPPNQDGGGGGVDDDDDDGGGIVPPDTRSAAGTVRLVVVVDTGNCIGSAAADTVAPAVAQTQAGGRAVGIMPVRDAGSRGTA